MRKVKELDCKLIVNISYDYITVRCLNTLVDDGYITVVDACIHHRVPGNTTIEGCFRMPYQVTVKVKPVLQIVVGWTWETCFY